MASSDEEESFVRLFLELDRVSGLSVVAECFDRVRSACADAGRDPSSIVLSVAQTLGLGRDEAEVRRRAAAIGGTTDELRAEGLGGTVAEVVDKIGRLADLGAGRVYLQVLDLGDLDQLELVASEVAPQL